MANKTDPIQAAKDILERVKTKNVEEKTMTKSMEKVREMMTTREAAESDIKETLEKMETMTEEEIEELLKNESDLADKTNEATAKDEDELEEAETILDVDDAQAADGKKATDAPKGKKKIKEPKMSASDASGKIDTPAMKEHVDAIFSGEELSEEFRTKATTIFESAVSERVTAINEELHTEYSEKLDEAIETTKEELSKKLDDYLGYVVEEWMKENELALELGIKSELAESFLTGLHGLFESHYISVPEDRTDLLEELVGKVSELEGHLNESLEKNVELRKGLIEARCVKIFADVSKGLVDTEIEKFNALSEGIEFETEEQYKEKLTVLRESYFSDTVSVVTEDSEVEENTAVSATPSGNSVMDRYSSAISDQIKKL
jgi:hypothetical protein